MSEASSRRRTARTTRARHARLPESIQQAVDAARDKKAVDVVVLDLRKSDAFTDFFVIATGTNSRQVQAIADEVEHVLKTNGIRPANIEGHRRAEWVLLDYFDFVVHVFSPAARTFYGLDRLWAASARIDVDNTPER